jgi:predicted O-linked N-acetylglucosamine transferase (SPINDLY family)
VGALFNLGAVLIQLGETGEARSHLERALRINPRMTDAAVLIADACEADGDLEGARRALLRALAIEPRHAGVLANLGKILMALGEMDAAESSLKDALRIDPRSLPALVGLARLNVRSGRATLAEAQYRAALAIDPGDVVVWSSFLFSLNMRPDMTAEAVALEHFEFGRTIGCSTPADRASRSRSAAPIRLGYVSADLSKHPVGFFLRPVLAAHDKSAFEVFCYSNSHGEDELTVELRKHSNEWRCIAGRDDQWVDRMIRKDALDILVDLSGHTAHGRLGVFARRPAPVQATWLGYLNTTGLMAMDYRIVDRYTDPAGATESLSTETLVRLPHSQWCYVPYYDIPLQPVREQGDGAIVFGSFNQFAKLSDACVELWSEILRQVPGSLLRVHDAVAGGASEHLLERLAARGVERERVSLMKRTGIRGYFAAIEAVDIALDSMPYNGATTTLDTLWMGTPVVGLRGDRAIGRGTYSIVRAAGIDELAADDKAEYVRKNVQLAQEVSSRTELKRSLRRRLEASPLMDPVGFTHDLESLYLGMLNSR